MIEPPSARIASRSSSSLACTITLWLDELLRYEASKTGRLVRRADESECALNLPTNINAKIKSAIGVMRWNCRAIVRVLQIAQSPVSIRGIGYDRRGKVPAMSMSECASHLLRVA